MKLNKEKQVAFQNFIWDFYHQNGRQFAWRSIDNPYYVLVSEIMLQQTQTYRVEPKFEQFIIEFPTFNALADAPLRHILAIWQGLGYNRRALYLQQSAQKVVGEYNGILPSSPDILNNFPGIGPATAASICAFAFNVPTIFIETNIRTVFIHHFFSQQYGVDDKQLMPLVTVTLDHNNPRQWYYALMDYGVMLKKKYPNPNRRSIHYNKQTKFEGSDRKIRGKIIALLTKYERLTNAQLFDLLQEDTVRIEKIIYTLCHDNLIKHDNEYFYIA